MPEVLGHYRVVEKVGEGGMGVVYRAHDEHLEREVAIKILPAGVLADQTARKRFRREALALSKLSHPNVETVYDFDTQDGTDFLVIEYVPGSTLDDRLLAGPLSEKEVIRLGVQLCDGLAAAHEQGIVHRDLKPGNVRVTPDGRLKILDFGLAKLAHRVDGAAMTESLTEPGRFAGTLPYMAPEQFQGEALDARTDIWAAGILLYEMATGRRPFRAPGARIVHEIMHEAPVSPSAFNRRLSPGLEAVILKCLDKDPEHRYQSAKEIGVDLRRLTTASGIGVIPTETRRRSRMRFTGLAAIGLAVGLMAVLLALSLRWRWPLEGGTRQIDSLAVLPLANLSEDQNQEYFSDGMTDALITELAQIRALRVISRTSTMGYKRGGRSVPQIAKELNVEAVVEGSVRRSGNRVAVNVRLIDATDRPLWGTRIEREMRDVLGLQREVARAIAEQIKVRLTPEEKLRLASAPQVNPAAHEAYLKGEYLSSRTVEQRSGAKDYFEQAVKLDPNYAPAYAGLAEYYNSTAALDPRPAMPLARQNALKAIELDPKLAQAHNALGWVYLFGDLDWEGAEREFKRALELNPNFAEGHRSYSAYLSALGRAQEARAEVLIASELDPVPPRARTTAGWEFYYARQYALAAQECQAALELEPTSGRADACLGEAYLAQGIYDKAIAAYQGAVTRTKRETVRTVGLGRAYARAGRKGEAREILEEMRERSASRYVPPYQFALLYAALGEKDAAFRWLERACDERDRYVIWMKVDPGLDPLRTDARLQQLLRRVGFPP